MSCVTDPLHGFEWNEAESPADFDEGLLTILARDAAGSMNVAGTCFVIKSESHRAMAITAAHVLSYVRELQGNGTIRSHSTTPREFIPNPPPLDLRLSDLLATTRKEECALVTAFAGVAFDESKDFGVASLVPQAGRESDFPLREFLLDDEIPQVGQLICVASYMQLDCKTTDANTIALQRRAVLRVGKVTAVFPGGQRLCRGPCVETSIPVFGGMSGSPVFLYEDSGPFRVVGLLCSDVDPDGEVKNDRSVAGHSLAALLPVRRVSGDVAGIQEIELSFLASGVAGTF